MVREETYRAGAAALGLSEVAGALNQARVAHLIYDPLVRYQGSVGQDGTGREEQRNEKCR